MIQGLERVIRARNLTVFCHGGYDKAEVLTVGRVRFPRFQPERTAEPALKKKRGAPIAVPCITAGTITRFGARDLSCGDTLKVSGSPVAHSIERGTKKPAKPHRQPASKRNGVRILGWRPAAHRSTNCYTSEGQVRAGIHTASMTGELFATFKDARRR